MEDPNSSELAKFESHFNSYYVFQLYTVAWYRHDILHICPADWQSSSTYPWVVSSSTKSLAISAVMTSIWLTCHKKTHMLSIEVTAKIKAKLTTIEYVEIR